MQVTTIGTDLGKNIFQVHGLTEGDEVAFNQPLHLSRTKATGHNERSQTVIFVLLPSVVGNQQVEPDRNLGQN